MLDRRRRMPAEQRGGDAGDDAHQHRIARQTPEHVEQDAVERSPLRVSLSASPRVSGTMARFSISSVIDSATRAS